MSAELTHSLPLGRLTIALQSGWTLSMLLFLQFKYQFRSLMTYILGCGLNSLERQLGGIGTLTRVSTGVWRTIPEVRKFVQDFIREVVAVAAANGVSLPLKGIDMIHRGIDMLPKDQMTSMQEEIMICKPSELEYWNGAVVRLGKDAGVATPLNEVIYYSLLPQKEQALILDLRKNLIKPPLIL